MAVELIVLPDILAPNLKLVICGTAAGRRSASVGCYYAGRGNRFWRTLHRTGLTTTQLNPSEQFDVLQFGIGLTDLVKGQSGMDQHIDFSGELHAVADAMIRKWKPAVVCFNGKRAASEVLGIKSPAFGMQHQRIADAQVFVAPSTSGVANAVWDEQHWHDLALLVSRLRAGE